MEAENRTATDILITKIPNRAAATRSSSRTKPLADCTNTCSIHSSHSSSCATSNANTIPKLPSSSPLKPPPSTPSSLPGTANRQVSEPGSVYKRRQSVHARKSKGKEFASLKRTHSPSPTNPLASCYNKLMADEGNTLSKSMTEDGGNDLSKFLTEPCKKRLQRELHKDVQKHGLSQDFIEKQNAYFAEIDAFELPVEVASDDELD